MNGTEVDEGMDERLWAINKHFSIRFERKMDLSVSTQQTSCYSSSHNPTVISDPVTLPN
jgi:hypothetical protein